MTMIKVAVAALAMIPLAACSTIQTGAAPGGASAGEGLVYYLPLRTLQIDARFVISDCGARNGQAQLVYDVVPVVSTQIVADRSRPFAVTGLDGNVMKTLNFQIAQYDNGTLRSVNAVIEDRTAETITNVLTGASRIALGLTGLGTFSSGETRDSVTWLSDLDDPAKAGDRTRIENEVRAACGVRTTAALLRIRQLNAAADPARESTEARARLTAAVTTAQQAVTDARTNLRAANEARGTADIAAATRLLDEAVTALDLARQNLRQAAPAANPATASAQVAAIVQRDLTYTATKLITPPDDGADISETIDVLATTLQTAGIQTSAPLQAGVLLTLMRPGGASVAAAQPGGVTAGDGIYVRAPASARLVVCAGACQADGGQVRLAQTVTVPQWGTISRLRLRNMMFATSNYQLAFAPDGTLLSLSSQTSAPAERASAAFAQAGDILIDFATRRRTLRNELATAESAAERNEIQQQIDLLDLQEQLTAAQQSNSGEQSRALSNIQFEIDQVNRQIQLLEAQARLRALQAGQEP